MGANSVHALTVRPFKSTVQAPQYVVSQPMCVPVRFRFSRKNSTSSVRGSTTALRGSPFTRPRTEPVSTPAIFVSCLHSLAASAAQRDAERALHQCRHQRTLIVRGTAHVALRFGRFPCCFGRALNRLPVDFLATQLPFRALCSNRRQSDAAQYNTNLFANVLAIERQLHRRACGGINRRAALERQGRSTTLPP